MNTTDKAERDRKPNHLHVHVNRQTMAYAINYEDGTTGESGSYEGNGQEAFDDAIERVQAWLRRVAARAQATEGAG